MVTDNLEKAACNKMLHKLQNDNILPTLFLSDRHREIRLLLRKEFPTIIHEFDVWHIAKSLTKAIKSTEKKHLFFLFRDPVLPIICGGQPRHVMVIRNYL